VPQNCPLNVRCQCAGTKDAVREDNDDNYDHSNSPRLLESLSRAAGYCRKKLNISKKSERKHKESKRKNNNFSMIMQRKRKYRLKKS
jgi:hypothetical protein